MDFQDCSDPIEIVEKLLDAGVPYQGCSREEMEHLIQVQQVTYLPEHYRELMLRVGKKGASWIYHDYSGNYDDVLELRELALQEIHDFGHEQGCPDDVFFFAAEYWGHYLMFRTRKGNPDPPVYLFSRSMGGYWFKAYDSFSEFLMSRHILHTMNGQRIWRLHLLLPYITPCDFDPKQDELVEYHPSPATFPLFAQIVQQLFTKYDGQSQGCSDAEIDAIIHAQQVNWLPEDYRLFLKRFGKVGSEILLRKANYLHLMELKEEFLHIKQKLDRHYGRERIHIPEDVFVFGQDMIMTAFYFFRLKDRVDDPTIYVLTRSFVFKAADSLSAFVWRRVAPDPVRDLPFAVYPVYYDEHQDTFLPLTKQALPELL